MKHIENVEFRPASEHLESAIRQLEMAAELGSYNTFCIPAFGDAALLLDQPDLAERAIRLLSAAPDSAFLTGMITNIDLPSEVPRALRTLTSKNVLEQEHPVLIPGNEISRLRKI